jgi:hypothetical protein
MVAREVELGAVCAGFGGYDETIPRALPAFGLRAYQTRELKDVYGATDVPPVVPPKPPGSATP